MLPPFWRFPERSQGMVSLAIMAKYVYLRDRHYLVDEEGKVVIVDEKSGRVMAGRSWSHGIHQAIEAMEGLELSSPPKTSARMTFQTFFNRYHRLCGASGTLRCSAVSGGAISGLIFATMITYRMYRPASMMPGKNAPAYSCTTDTPAVAP